MQHSNREEWLQALAQALQPAMAAAGAPVELTHVRIGVGFPGGGARRLAIGQCWSSDASADRSTEIFISPVLGTAADVDHVLLHELIHAAVGVKAGHGAAFGKPARALGLVGKLTATTAGDDCRAMLDALTAQLGPYPHAALTTNGKKKDGTRQIKITCPACGYVARTSQKWLDVGLPTCCCGCQMIDPRDDGDGEDE